MSKPTYEELEKRVIELEKAHPERKKTEEYSKLLVAMLDSAPNSIMIHDTNGNFYYANKKAFEMHQYEEHEFMALNLHDIDVPESKALIAQRIKEIQETGEAKFEVSHFRKDKTAFSLEIYAKKVSWDGIPAIISIGTDISERKKAEKALLKSNNLLNCLSQIQSNYIQGQSTKTLFESLLQEILKFTESEFGFIGNIFYNDEGKPYLKTHAISNIAWNKETQKFYEENQAKGFEFTNLESLFGEVIKTGEPIVSNRPSDDSRAAGIPDGHPKLSSFLGLPFKSGESLLGMVGIANKPNGYNESDISFLDPLLNTCASIILGTLSEEKQKKAEEALKKSEERLKETSFIAKVGGWEIDLLGNTLAWTDETFKIYELTNDRHPDVSEAINFYHQDDQQMISSLVQSAIEKGEDFNFEARLITAKKNLRWVRSIGELIKRDGKVIGVHGTIQDITERKHAEEALQKSDKLLNSMGDIAKIGGWEINLESQELSWTQEVYRIHELSEDFQPTVDTGIDFYAPESKPLISKAVQLAIEQGESFDLELQIITAKGNLCWVRALGQAHQQGDKTVKVSGTFQDISESKRAKSQEQAIYDISQAVITSNSIEEFYFAIHRAIGAVIDTSNIFIALNEKGSDIITFPYYVDEKDEYPPDLSLNDSLSGTSNVILTGKTILKTKKDYAELVEDGEFNQYGTLSEIWLGVPLNTRERTIGAIVVQSFSDATTYSENDVAFLEVIASNLANAIQRVSSEKEIKESEEKFRLLADSSPLAIYMSEGIEQKAEFINKTFTEFFGYTIDEVPSVKQWWPLAYPDEDYRKQIENEWQKKVELAIEMNSEIEPMEVVVTCKDGSKKNISWGYSAIGKQNWAFGLDLTERKRLEEQLQIRQRMDSLGTLSGGIAHDFNNILVGIMGNISLLSMESESFTERQKKMLNNADESTKRAANLIRQFQALSIGAVTKKTNVDIHDISKEVFNLLTQTTDRLIKKKVKFKKGEFIVIADSGELHQVLLNLGTNSTHAIEEQGVKEGDYIRISAENYEASTGDKTGLKVGHYVHLSFKDTGGGMSDEVLKRAFDPMFTTKDMGSKKGQGLGLSMVYNIVTNINNGHIYIDSKKGKGTTIHIYLPKARSATDVKEKDTFEMKGGSETILVVDDEEIVTTLAENLLTNIGYTVLTACDGKEALEIYKKQQDSIDAVILDLSMPQMSGKQVFQEMLKINSDVKVIISSGHGDEHSKEGVLAQARGNIGKPYGIKDLARAVRTVLDL